MSVWKNVLFKQTHHKLVTSQVMADVVVIHKHDHDDDVVKVCRPDFADDNP